MTHNEFIHFNDQPCRFKLRSGKEIFGVIRGTHGAYYFYTLGERIRQRYRSGASDSWGQSISLDDVVGAEFLSGSDLMVG